MQVKPIYLAATLALCGPALARTPGPATPSETPSAPTPSAPTGPSAAPANADEAPAEGETIVVTAVRRRQTLAEATSSVTVITRREIEQKKSFDILDVLRLAPSLAVSQSGTFGKVASVFLRGANSNHTLVLIDGVRGNSPADGRFDFGAVPVENIERIEVLRGPQSALYGSDAIGGVINIITRRGDGAFRTGGRLELGNRGTNKQVVTAHGSVGKTDLSFSATRLRSNGFFTNDDYRNVGASLRLDRALSAHSGLSFISRIESADVGAPGQEVLSFDPNARSKPRDIFSSLQFSNRAGHRSDKISLGVFDRRLHFNDPVNPGAGFASFTDSILKDRVLSLDGQSSFNFGRHVLTAGGELRRETANGNATSSFGPTNFDQGITTRALFIQDEFRARRLSIVPGLRLEDNSQFGSDLNGRLAAAYDLSKRSRLKASIGTGFRAPSINDLYFPNFGNPALEPEKSIGYEAGFEHQLGGGGRFEATLFYNRFRNLIGTVATTPSSAYPFGVKAGNAERARTQGVEFFLDQPFGKGFRAIISQSFLSTSSSGSQLLRRPHFTTAADLLYRHEKWNFDLGLAAQGRRFDNDFAAPPFGTGRGAGFYPGYSRLDLTAGYDLRPGLQIYGRLQNLLNRHYEEVAGFPAPRFNFVVGLQAGAF